MVASPAKQAQQKAANVEEKHNTKVAKLHALP